MTDINHPEGFRLYTLGQVHAIKAYAEARIEWEKNRPPYASTPDWYDRQQREARIRDHRYVRLACIAYEDFLNGEPGFEDAPQELEEAIVGCGNWGLDYDRALERAAASESTVPPCA